MSECCQNNTRVSRVPFICPHLSLPLKACGKKNRTSIYIPVNLYIVNQLLLFTSPLAVSPSVSDPLYFPEFMKTGGKNPRVHTALCSGMFSGTVPVTTAALAL